VGSDRGNGTTSDVLFNSVFTRLRCIAWCSGSVPHGKDRLGCICTRWYGLRGGVTNLGHHMKLLIMHLSTDVEDYDALRANR
jgi:hypothetical protein